MMYGKNWSPPKKQTIKSNKRRMMKSIVIAFIFSVIMASIFSSIYITEMNRMTKNIDFIITDVTMTSFSSISISYQINMYDDSISCRIDGKVFVNNWSYQWESELSMNGIIHIQNIPISSVIPFFVADTFEIRIYGDLIKKMTFSSKSIINLHYRKSFSPNINCTYHEFGNFVNITFYTIFQSPILNIGGDVNISYNAMINVTDSEINRGSLNMEVGFYSAGNVSILHSFENLFVAVNATSTYNFYMNVYDPPDALWTFIIAERLSHKLDGLPDTDPCVLITNLVIECGGFVFNLPSKYVEVMIS